MTIGDVNEAESNVAEYSGDELEMAELQLVESMRESHTWQRPLRPRWGGRVTIGDVNETESHMADFIKAELERQSDNWWSQCGRSKYGRVHWD